MIDFMCVGVPKCGTTTLYEVLKQCKNISFPDNQKNAYYYDEKKGGYKVFEKRYSNEKLPPFIKQGIFPENWYLIANPKKMAKDFPANMKFLFIIRNPIEQVYSYYRFSYVIRALKGKDEKEFYEFSHAKAFERYVVRNRNRNNSLLEIGKYYKKIAEYYKYFNKNLIKVVVLEDSFGREKEFYNEIFSFLGVKNSEDENINYFLKCNEGNLVTTSPLKGFLFGEIRTKFLLQKVCWKWGINKKIPLINKIIKKMDCLRSEDKDKTKITPKTYNILSNYYRKDIEQLNKLLNRNLFEVWLKKEDE